MLNAMRFGKLGEDCIQAFRSLSRPVKYNDGIGPTQLYETVVCVVCRIIFAQTPPDIPLVRRWIEQTK
jgi:hypothetical protein